MAVALLSGKRVWRVQPHYRPSFLKVVDIESQAPRRIITYERRSLTLCIRGVHTPVTTRIQSSFLNAFISLVGSWSHVSPSRTPHSVRSLADSRIRNTFIWQQYHYLPWLRIYPTCQEDECLFRAIQMPSTRPTDPPLKLGLNRSDPMPQYNAKRLMDSPLRLRSKCLRTTNH